MVDFDFIPYIIMIVTVVGAVTGLYFKGKERKENVSDRKDKVEETRAKLQQNVENTLKLKTKEEEATRKELESSAKVLALDVKQSMKEHIGQLIATLKQDIALSAEQAEAKIDKLDYRLAQIKIDLMEHILLEKDEDIRIQKQIDFIKQMKGGKGGKGGEGGEGGESAEGKKGERGEEGREGEEGEGE